MAVIKYAATREEVLENAPGRHPAVPGVPQGQRPPRTAGRHPGRGSRYHCLSPKLPRDLDGQTLVRALERAGFVVERQSGAHAVLIHLALTAARDPV